MKQVECVPNFSAGRDVRVVEAICDCFRRTETVQLLNSSCDPDHNRMVVTAIGAPEAMAQAILQAVGVAIQSIDLNTHKGTHPRLGAADVIPFIPLQDMHMEEAVELSKRVAAQLAETYQLPVYLYEYAATAAHRRNLADVRRGEFENLAQKMQDPAWFPDYGPHTPHPTAGASIVGARPFLIAWNVNLKSEDLSLAQAIAKKIRQSNGGLPFCKALGMRLDAKNMVQVSMNLTNFSVTSMLTVFEAIRSEASAANVEIAGSELIGMLPLEAVVQSFAQALQLESFSSQRILETHQRV
ncbi:MAG: glutamate formimidoyltransferase [Bacteroidales bacterium]|nr:glutamate formimidoyltransferase [Bacteroidales bacterium]MDD4771624.1 glutamate formimidoyltransferase [Bacteroidales bacterium]